MKVITHKDMIFSCSTEVLKDESRATITVMVEFFHESKFIGLVFMEVQKAAPMSALIAVAEKRRLGQKIAYVINN